MLLRRMKAVPGGGREYDSASFPPAMRAQRASGRGIVVSGDSIKALCQNSVSKDTDSAKQRNNNKTLQYSLYKQPTSNKVRIYSGSLRDPSSQPLLAQEQSWAKEAGERSSFYPCRSMIELME